MILQTVNSIGMTATYDTLDTYVNACLMDRWHESGAVESAANEIEALRFSYARLLEVLERHDVIKLGHLPYIVEGAISTEITLVEE